MTETINGFLIHYEQLGQGPDVLLLHGWGYDLTLLLPLARALSDRYRVTLADMPGHGGSPEPEQPITVYEYAEIVSGLLDRLAIQKTNIVGHSFGCRLSLILAAKHPEKVNRLVLCGAAGLKDKRGFSYYRKVYTYKIAKFFIKTFAPKKFDAWRKNRGSADYRQLSDTMKATFSKIVNEDLAYLLPDVKAPTFLVWGENDTATPLWMAETMEKTIPDCAKVVYAGRTHYAFLEELPRTLAIVKTFFG